MRNWAALVAVGAVGSLSLTGCSKVQEMHDATTGMAETTTKMADTTRALRDLTDATYTDLRQGNSLTIRTERLMRMENAESIEAKISEAGKYMMAMEFQLYKLGVDEPKAIEHLYEEAIVEIFRAMKDYMSSDEKLSPASGNDRMQNLYSLAAALHRVNPNQISQAEKYGLRPVSVLDLIQDALVMGTEVVQGVRDMHEVPTWAREVLRVEGDAIYLLRLRHNFLGAMPLAAISAIEEDGFLGIRGFFRKGFMFLKSWKAKDLNELNVHQLEFNVLVLEYSLATRDFLESIGIDPMTDKKLQKIWKNMRLPSEMNETNRTRSELLGRFTEAVDRLVSGN